MAMRTITDDFVETGEGIPERNVVGRWSVKAK